MPNETSDYQHSEALSEARIGDAILEEKAAYAAGAKTCRLIVTIAVGGSKLERLAQTVVGERRVEQPFH